MTGNNEPWQQKKRYFSPMGILRPFLVKSLIRRHCFGAQKQDNGLS